MNRPNAWRCAGLMLFGLMLTGCSGQKEAAQKDLGEIEATVQAVGPDAQRYAPDHLATVQETVSKMTTAFNQGDYQGILAVAPRVLASVQELTKIVAAKKKQELDALNSEWSGLATAMPEAMEKIDHRIETLEKSGRLPYGLDKQQLTSAQTTLKDTKATWAQAAAEFSGGHASDAVEKAKKIQQVTNELMSKLGIPQSPAGHS